MSKVKLNSKCKEVKLDWIILMNTFLILFKHPLSSFSKFKINYENDRKTVRIKLSPTCN